MSLQANIFSCYMTRRGGNRKACCVCRRLKLKIKPLSRRYPPVQIPFYQTKKPNLKRVQIRFILAEKAGFEPALRYPHTTPLAGEPLQPLGYFSVAEF